MSLLQTPSPETISKESRSQGVFYQEILLFLLNSLAMKSLYRKELSLRSQGVKEFFSEDSPFLLNSLAINNILSHEKAP